MGPVQSSKAVLEKKGRERKGKEIGSYAGVRFERREGGGGRRKDLSRFSRLLLRANRRAGRPGLHYSFHYLSAGEERGG